jgi:hypothetical protein
MKMHDHRGQPVTLEELQRQVGKGWSELISKLVTDLELLGWDGNVYQVKEKFGGLRFYIGPGNNAIDQRIHDAERDSYTICETCGAPGKLRGGLNMGHWLKTRCDACHRLKS